MSCANAIVGAKMVVLCVNRYSSAYQECASGCNSHRPDFPSIQADLGSNPPRLLFVLFFVRLFSLRFYPFLSLVITPFTLLRAPFRCVHIYVALLASAMSTNALAATPIDGGMAQNPIVGGLGIEFSHIVDPTLLGAEYAFTTLPHASFANNRIATLPKLVELPIQQTNELPWRRFAGVVLPRPLREISSNTFIMLNDNGSANRITSIVEHAGCDDHFDWMHRTLVKKYDVDGAAEVLVSQAQSERGIQQAIRISFSEVQIDVSCGNQFVIDYAHYGRIATWLFERQKLRDQHQFELRELATKRKILDQQRAVQFANSFTLGDQFRLQGAFGIAFARPFAAKSKQTFPVDEPFYAQLPNLPERFAAGEIKVEISPERMPITIRGRFPDISFEEIHKGLQAKYGSPLKSTSRHLVYKVSGNHVIVRKKKSGIELTFIDSLQQDAQRKRRWRAETEGL